MAINPDGIPQFAGDPDTCETHGQELVDAGGSFRTIGSDVHANWQGLKAFYEAPEAEELFAATGPIKTTTAEFGGQVETVGHALKDYAVEIRPLVSKLKSLKSDATAFVASIKDKGDDAWKKQDNVDRNNQLVHDVDNTIVALQAAERRCANRIGALYGHAQWVVDDGSNNPNAYGIDKIPDNADRPWGNPEEKRPDGFWEHVGGFFKGVVVDGLWGDLKGLYHMVAFWTPEFKETWSGLWFLVSGWATDFDKWGEAWKNVGKSLIAWDAWASGDWGRASGIVLYNVATLVVAPAKIATLARSGKLGAKAAKVAAVVDKLDLGRLARFAVEKLPAVKDIAAGLDKLKLNVAAKMDDLAAKLPQLQVHMPGVGPVDLGDLNRSIDPTTGGHHGTDPGGGHHGGDAGGGHHGGDAGGGHHSGDGGHGDGAGGHGDGSGGHHGDGSGGHGDGPDQPGHHPDTPRNDPTLDKSDPADRAKIREQVEQIRQQTAAKLNEFAHQAWDAVDSKWDDLKEHKFKHALEEGAPEHLLKGGEVGREFERRIHEHMGELIDPGSGFRIRTEVSYNAAGDEVSRGALGSRRPDVVLERLGPDGWEAVHVWDLKTGDDLIGTGWADEVNRRVDPVFEPETINPNLPPGQVPVPAPR